MTNKEMINRPFDDANTSNALDALDCVEEKKPQTNADRIRAMTDEELMLWLYAYADGSGKTREQWLEWLKEEVEDD